MPSEPNSETIGVSAQVPGRQKGGRTVPLQVPFRQVMSATDSAPFGTRHFTIPFDAAGKAWVRFAVWDSAGDGAFVQPIWLNAQKTTN